jgi:hypothetical protein
VPSPFGLGGKQAATTSKATGVTPPTISSIRTHHASRAARAGGPLAVSGWGSIAMARWRDKRSVPVDSSAAVQASQRPHL